MKQENQFKYASIGTVIHGTMRNEDLIPAFCDELEYHAKRNNNLLHLNQVDDIRNRFDIEDYFDSEDADYDLNEVLFQSLNEYALPYMYFGSHPGDGSDYGFWLSESFESDFDGLKVSDTGEIPSNYVGEAVQISDHGNCTLYYCDNGKLTEIWAVV